MKMHVTVPRKNQRMGGVYGRKGKGKVQGAHGQRCTHMPRGGRSTTQKTKSGTFTFMGRGETGKRGVDGATIRKKGVKVGPQGNKEQWPPAGKSQRIKSTENRPGK